MKNECDLIRERYEKRETALNHLRYNVLNPPVYMSMQEKERALIKWIYDAKIHPIENKRLLEIGCGTGANLLQFIRLGFDPANLVGNELLEDRVTVARKKLPQEIKIIPGDASEINMASNTVDIVYQSMVFTSILDMNFRLKLARRMWELVKPGGGILWYDFIYDNPRNSDVKGISVKEVRNLFPSGDMKTWRVTLAPPISRVVTKICPLLYNVINLLPLFRTHVLCWIEKPK